MQFDRFGLIGLERNETIHSPILSTVELYRAIKTIINEKG